MPKMLPVSFTLLAIAVITACASAQPTPSTAALQQKVLAAEVVYEAPLTLAIAYNKRPRCTIPKTIVLCSDPAVVDQIRKANHAVMTAFDAAMNIAATPGVTDSAVTAAIAVATQAIGPLQSILDIYK
jgi:hypothetical protein